MNINSCHILLKNVLFFAHHGVAPQETVTGNEFYIDLKLKTDFRHAAVTDELDDTISYADIYTVLKQEMEIPSKLLEHVCDVSRPDYFKSFRALKR